MATQPYLLTVPQELFELVAGNLGPKDLGSLRLAGREPHGKAQDVFKKVCFADYSVMLSDRASLETTLDIIHDATFGPCIKKLVIFTEVLACTHALNLFPEDPMATQHPEALKHWREQKEANEQLHKSGQDTELLITIFDSLARLPEFKEVEIADSPESRARKVRTLEKSHCWDPELSSLPNWPETRRRYGFTNHPDPNNVFAIIINTLIKSSLQPKRLAVKFRYRGLRVYDLDDATLSVCRQIFGSLEELRLRVCQEPQKETESTTTKFVDTFASAPRLRRFELDNDSSLLLGEVLKRNMPNLQHLSVEGSQLDAASLVSFVKGNPSLKSLDLSDVTFSNESEQVLGKYDRHEGMEEEEARRKQIEDDVKEVIGLPGNYEAMSVEYEEEDEDEDEDD